MEEQQQMNAQQLNQLWNEPPANQEAEEADEFEERENNNNNNNNNINGDGVLDGGLAVNPEDTSRIANSDSELVSSS